MSRKGVCGVCGAETSRIKYVVCIVCARKKREGKPCQTPSSRLKISESHKGEKNPYYGKKHTQEIKLKMRLKSRKGEKHLSWKGGVTKINRKIRTCAKMLDWRNAVFIRDNYTCQRTGQHGGDLEAHHLISLSTLMKAYNIKTLEDAEACEALWCIDNGITLAKQVHKELHKTR